MDCNYNQPTWNLEIKKQKQEPQAQSQPQEDEKNIKDELMEVEQFMKSLEEIESSFIIVDNYVDYLWLYTYILNYF